MTLSFQKRVYTKSGNESVEVSQSYLVTVSPEVVLGADVLVGVLGLLFTGSVVCHVLPMSVPSQLGIDAGNDHAGNGDAAVALVVVQMSTF